MYMYTFLCKNPLIQILSYALWVNRLRSRIQDTAVPPEGTENGLSESVEEKSKRHTRIPSLRASVSRERILPIHLSQKL